MGKYKRIILFSALILLIFALYLHTTFPAFKNNDSPETAATIYTLGIAHPPAYPLFTMAGKIFTLLPIGSPAFRANLFSVFLAVLIVIFTFFILHENSMLVFKKINTPMIAFGIIILATSYIFWNQAIEAKGGIYMLNLLFFVILLFIGIKIQLNYDLKKLYLFSFIFGLSMANHWPSTVILVPAFIYIFAKYLSKIKLRQYLLLACFFILGVSPYLYLYFRSLNQEVFVFMARPDNLKDFLWTIFRLGYTNDVKASVAVYIYLLREFFTAILTNYFYLVFFAIAGGYALRKIHKQIFNFYMLLIISISLMVVIVNKAQEQIVWVIDIFIIPVQYILFIMIMLGIIYAVTNLKNLKLKITVSSFVICFVISGTCLHFIQNNNRLNYLSYDFGSNVIKSVKDNSLLLLEGDFYAMPISYFDLILHRTNSFNHETLYSLQFDWGIKRFNNKYTDVSLLDQSGAENAIMVIKKYSQKGEVYLCNYVKTLQVSIPDRKQRNNGILYRFANPGDIINTDLFDIYSYRGIFHTNNPYDTVLARQYGQRIAETASDLYNLGKFNESISMYNKVLHFPIKGAEGDIYYNLSFNYGSIKDYEKQLFCLQKAIQYKPDFWPSYEEAGKLYYAGNNYSKAKEMFQKSLSLGSWNKAALANYIAILDGLIYKQEKTPFNNGR